MFSLIQTAIENKLAISLESIKRDEVVAQAGVASDVATNARSSEIILSDFFAKINPTDTSFSLWVHSCTPRTTPQGTVSFYAYAANLIPWALRRESALYNSKEKSQSKRTGFLELLPRFELGTSSLPRMRSTY